MIGRLVVQAALVLAVAVTGAGLVPPHASAAPADTAPGTIVETAELDRSAWIPGAANGIRVTYWTVGPLARPALSTGAVFLPPGEPPPGGWPVVSWAHGTVGLADRCSPTVTGKIGGPYLGHWLSQGYAIVATDYVGLGTPGVHPYLDGASEAHSVVDMVRAARAAEPSLSPRWVVLGQSQGGQAAMVTASLATRYAPELDFRGGVATGAPSNLENLAPLVRPGFPQLPLTGTTVFVTYILAGLRATRPDLDIDSYLTDVGRAAVGAAESKCYEEMAPQLRDVSVGDLVVRPADDPALLAALRDMLGVPTAGYDRPVFLGQGLTDEMVPAPLALKLAADLATNRQPVTFRTYPTGHLQTMLASLPDTTPFVRGLFGG
ncbi:lipase [Prescottella agglutinans]|uniref:Lipase n=1 Tax=Prescottella agglutinans TaxID=1644129 RepID=A0A438BDL5_9NOCA|nr:lipase family protein [Prescottella agglutinans]RVW09103.1 lipase [Prescottella agglutinans]